MDSICQNISCFLNLPKGTIPPSFMLTLLSGIIFSRSISFTTPRPLQWGQAPSGELNEKIFGAASLYAMPVVGHISLLEKYFASPVSLSSIITRPSPCFMAVDIVVLSLSLSVLPTAILSTTTSMLWFLYLSTFMSCTISIIVPSTRT